MRRNGYGGYRGRKTGREVLKYLIVGLIVLIGVLAAILFLGEKEPEREQQTEQSQQVQEPETNPEPEPEPEPEAEPEPFLMQAVEVSMSQVTENTWRQELERAGGNAVVVNMKPDDGTLSWEQGRSVEEGVVNAALWRMNGTGYYTVARISCFRDEAAADTYEYCIHSNSGYRWKDFGGIHWVSPANLAVQDRLIEQAVELAQLGFSEILLDNCGYPPNGSGEMGWIKRSEVYDPEHMDVVVGAFLTRMREALEPWAVKLSIRTDAEVMADPVASRTGLTGRVLEEHTDRIWMSGVETDAPLAELLSNAGVSDVGERLVTETAVLTPENLWKQAVVTF